jgi:hypothetical protein
MKPVESRKIFIRQALVEGGYETRAVSAQAQAHLRSSSRAQIPPPRRWWTTADPGILRSLVPKASTTADFDR